MNFERYRALVRASDWWGRKVALVLGIAYTQILFQHLAPARAIGALIALLISATLLAAAAHVLTDHFDLEEDCRAGKRNALERFTGGQRVALYFGLCISGLVPWLIVGIDASAIFWLAVIYAAPILYAVPPVRLKERGIWGAIADATMAHGAPTMFVIALFTGLTTIPSPNTALLTLASGVWGFAYGMRGILLHQVFDWANDTRAGVNTFVARVGPTRAHDFIARFILPAELFAFGAVLMIVFLDEPVFSIALLFFGVMDILKVTYLWQQKFDPVPIRQSVYIFPQAVYEIWFPLVPIVLLMTREVWYGLGVVAQVILFHQLVLGGTRDVLQVFVKAVQQLRYRTIRVIKKFPCQSQMRFIMRSIERLISW